MTVEERIERALCQEYYIFRHDWTEVDREITLDDWDKIVNRYEELKQKKGFSEAAIQSRTEWLTEVLSIKG